jgi:medium-chain acyl-[acyl-carrier-protein] hydrolase
MRIDCPARSPPASRRAGLMKVGRNKCTITPETRPDAAIRLLCFHHAGAGAYSFRAWSRMLRPDVELLAAQLPGRENRYSEPLLYSADAVLDELISCLDDSLGPRYVIFGHSLGALLAYRFANRVRKTGELPQPLRLFLSSACVPGRNEHDGSPRAGSQLLSDEALIKKITTLAGTPVEILNDAALLDVFLPVLRADFAVLSQANCATEKILDIPFTLLGGSTDPTVRPEDIDCWKRLSSRASETHILQGGHFYLQRSQAALLQIINAVLGDHIANDAADNNRPTSQLNART